MKKIIVTLALILPLAVSAQKFGHINSQDIFQQMPERTVVQQKMDTLMSQYESQMVNMQEEINKKITDYQQNQATMADAIKQIRGQEIEELKQRYELFVQTAQQDLQKKQQEFLTPIYEKMQKAVKAVGDANSYTYIFDAGAMTYISPDADDVTPLVKKELGIK
mgnify:CR=1 FL=1